ncbi:T9SS type A sorting domain-containing protein [Candidatus Gracilibacteria bacterium]|nr:T9SS type A sorting domain-containing protein [Candidatus Gracilibacteria bacterium]
MKNIITTAVTLVLVFCSLSFSQTQLSVSTFVGGLGEDAIYDMVLLPNGDKILAVVTDSSDLPTPGCTVCGDKKIYGCFGGKSIYLARINSTGSQLLRALYIGGSEREDYPKLALYGNTLYVAFSTFSFDIGCDDVLPYGIPQGNWDNFIVALNVDDFTVLSSTWLGGISTDRFQDLAVNNNGIYVLGTSMGGSWFPVTPNAYQPENMGQYDFTVTKFSHDLSSRQISTYLGGSEDDGYFDKQSSLKFTTNGNIVLSGPTGSLSDFPIVDSLGENTNSLRTAIAVLSPDLQLLRASVSLSGIPTSMVITPQNEIIVAGKSGNNAFFVTYQSDLSNPQTVNFGGNCEDVVNSMTEYNGVLFFAGISTNASLPGMSGTYQTVNSGEKDGFIVSFNRSTQNFSSSFIGGIGIDEVLVVKVDANGVYLGGKTGSPDFPINFYRAFDPVKIGIDGFYSALSLNLTDPNGTTGVSDENIPANYSLSQNYPNPFNPSTMIEFSIPEASYVSLKIYDMLGREVETLINEQVSVGTHSLSWNASHLSSGLYIYKVQAGSFTQTKKMILMK